MTLQQIAQRPISLMTAQKTDLRTQFAALCYRTDRGKLEILLITGRGSGRWIIPRGWPIDGKTPAQCAATEAWEEAGARGDVGTHCVGLFSYPKTLGADVTVPCVAMVYPLHVTSLAKDYPEAGQRKRKWLRPRKAAARVDSPGLAQLILGFDPARQT